jgi:hypothetical protein
MLIEDWNFTPTPTGKYFKHALQNPPKVSTDGSK